MTAIIIHGTAAKIVLVVIYVVLAALLIAFVLMLRSWALGALDALQQRQLQRAKDRNAAPTKDSPVETERAP